MIKHVHSCLFVSLLAVAVQSPATLAADILIEPWTSSWKYLDDGSNQGDTWQTAAFDDSSWASGLAQLGYGDGDEATVVNSGPADNHFITTYFRHSFNVADASAYQSLTIDALRDDGIVVYLNGIEIWRDNMPVGAINHDTVASSAISGGGETSPVSITLASSALQTGNNVLAVEIHQVTITSTDISFALQLTASATPPPPPPNPDLSRGPYLQMITPTSAIIRWRTPVANDSRVQYGTSAGNLNNQVSNATTTTTTEHEIQLTGLSPANTYYYSIGTTTEVIGSGSDYFFKTQPVVGTKTPTRIWVIGDSGRNNTGQREVYQGYLDYTGSIYTDLWLLLGDNAYNSGTDAEYQAGFFDIYTSLMRQTGVWPSLGNHDGYSVNTPLQTGPYYDIFTLPTTTSTTEAYYSFDHGNIHFISLDSFDADRSSNAAMANWLKQDLAATTSDWIIAYWHHPPYSKGSHDSDTSDGNDCGLSSTGFCSWNAMIEMRSNILPILEARGVDLVLTGHSHSYERSKFVDGHYGFSSTYNDNAHAIDSNSGDPGAGAQAYVKAYPSVPNGGTVYAVAGTSASADGGSLNHPVMFRSLNQLGSLVLDVNDLLLTAKFIDTAGVVQDSFTLQKQIYPKQRHDRNADGDSDVLVRSIASGNWTSYNIRNASIKGNNPLNIPADNNTVYVAQLDANGDKDADILTRDNNTGAWTLHQIQNGAVVVSTPLYLYASTDMQFVGTGDFNNDGTDDVMLRSVSAGYYTVFLLGNHAVASAVFYNAWASSQSVPQGIGDFDGDGTDDLLVRRNSDNLYFIFRTIDGAASNVTCACNLWRNPDWVFQFAGDTNNDDIDDIIIRGTGASADGKWWAFRMNNFVSTQTTNLNLFSNKAAVSFAASGDYNLDGTVDVLTRVNSATTYVSPLNNGLVTANTLLSSFTTDQQIGK